MKIKNMHFLVTGGSGYLGEELVQELLNRGAYVSLLTTSEHDLTQSRLQKIKWNLNTPQHGLLQENFDPNFPPPRVIIHLAHSWSNQIDSCGENINFAGTVYLYEWAKKAGIKFIFASTVSAKIGALNQYGKIKYRIESYLDAPDARVARIGLVYGGKYKSQWGFLFKIVGKTRILPMINPWVRVQPIHIREVIEGLISLSINNNFSKKIYILANTEDISFGVFLNKISKQVFNRGLIVIPISGNLVLKLINLLPNSIVDKNSIKERILGLQSLTKIDVTNDLLELSIKIGRVEVYSQDEIRKSKLTKEATLLMKSILNRNPSQQSVEKYIKAIDQYYYSAPYYLPCSLNNSFLLKFIEPLPYGDEKNPKKTELLARLNLALGILESGEGAYTAYNYLRRERNFFALLRLFISEIFYMPFRFFFWKFYS